MVGSLLGVVREADLITLEVCSMQRWTGRDMVYVVHMCSPRGVCFNAISPDMSG